jgi:hypothetical protein
MNDDLPSIAEVVAEALAMRRAFEELEAEGLVCSFKRPDGQTAYRITPKGKAAFYGQQLGDDHVSGC